MLPDEDEPGRNETAQPRYIDLPGLQNDMTTPSENSCASSATNPRRFAELLASQASNN